jgi:hypothetical protein
MRLLMAELLVNARDRAAAREIPRVEGDDEDNNKQQKQCKQNTNSKE